MTIHPTPKCIQRENKRDVSDFTTFDHKKATTTTDDEEEGDSVLSAIVLLMFDITTNCCCYLSHDSLSVVFHHHHQPHYCCCLCYIHYLHIDSTTTAVVNAILLLHLSQIEMCYISLVRLRILSQSWICSQCQQLGLGSHCFCVTYSVIVVRYFAYRGSSKFVIGGSDKGCYWCDLY